MSEEIIKVLEYIGGELGIAIDWTTENVIPYVEEVIGKFVTYKIIGNSIGLLIGITLMITAVVSIRSLYTSYNRCVDEKKSNSNWHWSKFMGVSDFDISGIGMVRVCISVAGVIFGPTVIFGCGIPLLKWCVIPEIALLNELSYMLG